ncbi:MAG: hypothetical protein L6Q54_14675 [Leptospiraceae bacterium]|nr:hypothetical protein [Leptospiraceae bacterium]MCK6382478.1 hypothetical protein [Leptospiraceae bacterium]NUM41935.1 hypothetical protein [Leptospiraceae bacterium]
MGISKKLYTIFNTIFRFKKTQVTEEKSELKPKIPKGLEGELGDLRLKLSQFLITQKKESGLLLERKNFKVTKISEKLFRLEGKEKDGSDYSILISTGSYLSLKEEKISGLVFLSEADFNKTIAYEHSSLRSFFSRARGIEFDEISGTIYDNHTNFDWKVILNWEIFWQQQVFLRLNANSTALLLVTLEDSFFELFKKIATRKQKNIISEELFFLNQGVTSEEMNPHSKNKNLFDLDFALKDFKKVIEGLKAKREKEL